MPMKSSMMRRGRGLSSVYPPIRVNLELSMIDARISHEIESSTLLCSLTKLKIEYEPVESLIFCSILFKISNNSNIHI